MGVVTSEFSILSDLQDLDACQVITAKLWGVGESVAIWVDEDVPIDWDYECDGVIDEYYDPIRREQASYGFNNCDLSTVADIVDYNITVNLRALLGDESDVNDDGKISVVVSPVLNAISFTSEEEDDWSDILDSYADPTTDLLPFSEDNPCSDEQEVIYVFAPDPYGFYNSQNTPTVEEYTSMTLAAQIARSFTRLVLFNQKNFLCAEANEALAAENPDAEPYDCSVEEYWLTEAMAAVATDILGFGAIYYEGAWEYMDAPHLFSLTGGSEEDDLVGLSKGGYYLFGRWLVDNFGQSILADLAQNPAFEVGVDNVETITENTMGTLVTGMHVGLFASGVTGADGGELVDSGTWSMFDEATLISAPTSPPAAPEVGVYYGANGYQTGFNVRGNNIFVEGGTTDSPAENLAKRVVTSGTDYTTYVPGYDYYGFALGKYGVSVVRLTDLDNDVTEVQIEGAQGKLVGAVMRWNDVPVGEEDYVVEKVFSPTEVLPVELPALPADGSEILALGDISDPSAGTITIFDGELNEGTMTVTDTDRWLLDLTDRNPVTEPSVQVAIWLQRLYDDDSGGYSLVDPWVAVTRFDDLPKPDIDTFSSGSCTAGVTWNYPSPVPSWIADQIYLSSDAGIDVDPEEYDACGSASGADSGLDTGGLSLDCYTDWDNDGVHMSLEPSPSSFVEQVLVQQCTNNGNIAPAEVYSLDWVDADERDDDELPSINYVYDIGGRNCLDGEEAYLVVTLETGERYNVVVAGGDDIGPYQLHVKQLQ